jgi:ketosteroid isomerase-like protein
MKRVVSLLPVIFLFPLSLRGLQLPSRNRPGLSLSETFELYVRSVQRSDLEGLFSTVTKDEHLLFLTSDGRKIDSRSGYYDFHEEWFREKEWEMPVELLEIHEGVDYGWVTATFHYRSKIPESSRYDTYHLDSYFTLIFHKEEDMWKVVADFCAPISRDPRRETSSRGNSSSSATATSSIA